MSGLSTDKIYHFIKDREGLDMCLPFLKDSKIHGIDTETTGLDPFIHTIRLLQISTPENPVVVIDLWQMTHDEHLLIQELLSTNTIKIFQNAKFDLKFLRRAGFDIHGQIFDTMLAASLLRVTGESFGYGLDSLSKYYLNEDLSKEQQSSNWSGELSKEQMHYAARDASILLRLREAMLPELKKLKLIDIAKVEFDCIHAVVEMELTGVFIDTRKWEALRQQLEKEQEIASVYLKSKLGSSMIQISLFGDEVIGINLNSQQQLLKALKEKGIEIKNTSREELAPLASKHEIVKVLLEYKKASKSLQGFIHNLPKHIHSMTGRIHSSYYQIGTSTGRFSCSSPNLQQIPRDKNFRECFIPAPGHKLVIADYSQIELRVAAEISRDETMIEAYEKGQDLHLLTASLMTNKPLSDVSKNERQAAKAVNFGLIFAMGPSGLQAYSLNTYGVEMTLEQAQTFRKRFFEAYQGIARWHTSMRFSNVREIRTLLGRCKVYQEQPGIAGLYNAPVQGTAADINKNALGMLLTSLRGTGAKIIATIHDEIILGVPQENAQKTAEILKNTMETSGQQCLKLVPVIAETNIADSWAQK